MSSSSAAFFSFRVMSTSSGLGSGFRLGWLWLMMMLGTASRTACLSTSAARITELFTFPW